MISLENITITVKEGSQEKTLVDHLSLEIPELSIVSLVGGSGSGKTTTGLAILRLLPLALKIKEGTITFNNESLLSASQERMRSLRGKEISMIFQEPLDAFNPVFSIGYQIDEVLRYHMSLKGSERKERVNELLKIVGLDDPKRVAQNYPHQLSGGMRQRAMIAQAIAADPKLIIADEPTSNLDVTLQAKIMDLFLELKEKLNLSILLITHDLGMARHLSNHIAVMRDGKIVESGKTAQLISEPKHEYTRQLMQAYEM